MTYHDVATLRAQGGNVRVDYRGPCEDVESDEDDTPATRCQMVRSRNMCSNITGCDRMVMPSDGCCPVCGKYFKLTVQSLYIWTSWGWVLCPLWRGCPLLRGNKCTITMGSGTLWSEVVLFSEVTNVLSLWEVEISGQLVPLFRGCPLFRSEGRLLDYV